METTVADVDDHMEGDNASEANQESEDTRECNPPSDIIQSSKLKLSSDLEKSLKFTDLMGGISGMMALISCLGSIQHTFSDAINSCWLLAPRCSMICLWRIPQ